jgi:cell division septation protein DedD
MTRTGNEQEFVLGNKQLLSAFFVVVALLGICFAAGYTVGRNTGAYGDNASKKTAAVEPPPATSSTPPPVESGAQPSPVETLPEQTPSTKAAVEKRAVQKVEKPAEDAGAARVESAPGHTYLQVSAVKRPAAETIVNTLKARGFPALLGESSKPELFRVLVGPYSETDALAKAKSDLKALGFDAVVSK